MPYTVISDISATHLKSSQQDNGLLFQFIITELFHAFREMDMIIPYSQELRQRKRNSHKKQTLWDELTHAMSRLCGVALKQKPNQPTHNYSSHRFCKLKSLCDLFCENIDHTEKELTSLHRDSNRAWLHTTATLEAMNKATSRKQQYIEEFLTSLDKLHQVILRLIKTVKKIIPLFSDDENLLYFLLCHRIHIDEVYGSGATKRLLEEMYSGGVQEAGQFLLMRYSQRGFDQLLPSIQMKIEHLQS